MTSVTENTTFIEIQVEVEQGVASLIATHITNARATGHFYSDDQHQLTSVSGEMVGHPLHVYYGGGLHNGLLTSPRMAKLTLSHESQLVVVQECTRQFEQERNAWRHLCIVPTVYPPWNSPAVGSPDYGPVWHNKNHSVWRVHRDYASPVEELRESWCALSEERRERERTAARYHHREWMLEILDA